MPPLKDYDFCGWVTRNNIKCSDGRVIRRDAFAHQDGAKVPLVYMHNHDNIENVIGYTILENREEGVFGYTYTNDTPSGKHALRSVQHGDLDCYSIYANHLKETAKNVVHGVIKEVSLVLSGANKGAKITDVNLAHSDGSSGEAIIVMGDSNMEMYHSDESENLDDNTLSAEEIDAILDEMSDDELERLNRLFNAVGSYSEDDEDDEDADEQQEDEFEEGSYEDDYQSDDTSDSYDDYDYENVEGEPAMAHSDYYTEGENNMYNNVFDQGTQNEGAYLTHGDVKKIIDNAVNNHGSLKESWKMACEDLGLSHGDDDSSVVYSEDVQNYGVNDPSFLFPEYHNVNPTPEWIRRDMDWVSTVMTGVKHIPFARIKSQFADITADEARAKGYIKGNKKIEEVFTLLKRQTDPQTIYKKQKFDRDDIIDITGFDVIAWIKGEMRMMLNEEIARAILIGDGRSSASNDKIHETHIRPIWGDDTLFTIYKSVTVDPTDTTDAKTGTAKNFITTAIRARKEYKGSGRPILLTTEEWLTEMLLIDDSIGHPLYKTETELATRLRVSNIVTVPVMENVAPKKGKVCIGIIVNLNDYTCGADKGGAVEMFDDFDIDYNQYKYLIETRCSGANTKPYSAICLEIPASVQTSSQPDAE